MFEINFDALIQSIIEKGLSLLLLFALFFFIEKIALNYVKRFYKKRICTRAIFDQRADTLYKVFISGTHYTLYFLVGYATLSILGFPMATLIAGAGIAGLAIGLGAQGFINDLVNGIFILIEHQYDVNDTVIISGIEGKIKSIGLRITTLVTTDGAIVYIRNKDISAVKNLSKNLYRMLFHFYVTQPSDIAKIPAIIEQVNQQELPLYPNVSVKHTHQNGIQVANNGQLYYTTALFAPIADTQSIQQHFYTKYIDALEQMEIKIFVK